MVQTKQRKTKDIEFNARVAEKNKGRKENIENYFICFLNVENKNVFVFVKSLFYYNVFTNNILYE